MQLYIAVRGILGQLAASLCQLTKDEYARPCRTLSGSSVGGHVRHIIELYQALATGYDPGIVNYEKRKRDKILENDNELAIQAIKLISLQLDRPNKELLLEAAYDDSDEQPVIMSSNYFREIAYNLEHTVHHMAMIRIGIREANQELALPLEYGIASSTLKYRRQCAQ